MAYCGKCGAAHDADAQFCSKCGARVSPAQAQQNQTFQQPGQQPSAQEADILQNKSMAILAYIGILCLIPIFAAKKSPYARFHANQGLVLFLITVILNVVLSSVEFYLSYIFLFLSVRGLLNLALLALMIYGIVNAASGKYQKLPVVGGIQLLQ